MKKRRTIRQLAGFLRREFPTKKPVRVSICQAESDTGFSQPLSFFGETADKGSYFHIKINQEDNRSIQADTLLHEYAHTVADWTNKSFHSNKWGVAYARIYRKVNDE